ncbi:hypothetical protein MM236_15245 [Belliella sp. DSM 107340]|uniref:Uncharacterized protein n=1 Tax=Belliella calami TaxID=2923436 RepID=A0ABS9URW2_9BACT|nr:hypothetical protein [Belliella calami]MCH7399356.1 hypothetical protein [Belliella calami]
MDNIKTILLICINLCIATSFAIAQTAIEKQTVDGGEGTLLDFAAGTTKGIVIPAVESLPSTPSNGTFLFDKNDQIVKVYANGVWLNLSDEGDGSALLPYSGPSNGKKTVIGSRTSDANGVLVLESPDKAMILPKIASPHLNVPSPYPGMMCYDTDAKALAVFDGAVWNYWK